jgi:hypothetical protein
VNSNRSAKRSNLDLDDFGNGRWWSSILYVDSPCHPNNSTFNNQSVEDLIDNITRTIDKTIPNGKWFAADEIVDVAANVTGCGHGIFLLSSM